MSRPERTIAVVSHGGFLRILQSLALDIPGGLGYGGVEEYENCEMRSVVVADLSSSNSSSGARSNEGRVKDPYFWPGGRPRVVG